MDKLKAFESFVSVATRGSLTAAAKAEGVAPAIMGRGWMRWKSTWA
jgi:DNA-binding transcriptional LysR family regulator